jgi:Small Multidrug Resistance protein
MVRALTVNQSWAVLSAAILIEVAGTTSMRLSESFTRLTPSILIFVFHAISLALNTLVTRTLGLSVVYAVPLPWLKNRPYNAKAADLWHPWDRIEAYCQSLQRWTTQFGMGYIASGALREETP